MIWLLILSALVAVITDLSFRSIFDATFPAALTAASLCHVLLLHRFDDCLSIGKGLLLAQILFLAAYTDAKTHEIPDWIHPMLLCVGLIQLNTTDAVIGFFIVSVPFYLLARITHGGIGGGDIKLIACTGFVLGVAGTFFGTMFAMALFILESLIYYCRNRRHEYLAMAPCLFAGCFFAYLVI